MKLFGILIAVSILMMSVQACQKKEGVFEKAGKKMDKAVEDIQKQADQTKKDLEK